MMGSHEEFASEWMGEGIRVMRQFPIRLFRFIALGAAGFIYGCGGYVSTGGGPDFAITASAVSVGLTIGGAAQTVSVSTTATGGFSQSIQVTASGLPAGVTVSPSTFSLAPGASKQVSVAAASTATAGSATVQFTGTAGSRSHAVSVDLAVSLAVTTSGIDVVTYHNDVARTGLNPNESILTPANVTSSKFGLLHIAAVDGKVDGQPLYLSNLDVGGQKQNVVFAVTEHDSVYALNADTGAQLWKVSVLGANETTSGNHSCYQISPEIGITSTPVIDRSAGPHGTIFVVGMSQDPSGGYHQRLHALDVSTGAELPGSPTEISASYPGSGANSSGGKVIFDPGQYAERSALLLLNGTIYMGWTSHCDHAPYTGWLMAYNASTLAQSGVLNLTPNGSEGSIWMSGGGIAADSSGYIYFLDANGTFDTTMDSKGFPVNGNYGNGFIKVSNAGGVLAVADYFESSNTVAASAGDQDLGSGGVLLLPDVQDASGNVHHLAVGGGKDQIMYVVDRDSMGKFNAQTPNSYQQINGGFGKIYSTPAYFNNTLYYGSVNDTLKAFPITDAKIATAASVHSVNSFPHPGTTPAVSANGTKNGIVWAVENSSPAVLHAYDAATLEEIYNSSQAANGRDNFGNGNKFITPLVVNGKVFVGTPSGVAIFGLLP